MTHWFTNDYNTRIIIGNLYDNLSELFDTLMEEIIGTRHIGPGSARFQQLL
jgi:hypothetical protein